MLRQRSPFMEAMRFVAGRGLRAFVPALVSLCLVSPWEALGPDPAGAAARAVNVPLRTGSLVPEGQWIRDADARLALARILAHDDGTLDDALKQYRILLAQWPDLPVVHVETAHLLLRKGDVLEALSLADTVRGMPLSDPETRLAVADLEAALGHAARCRDLYAEAMGMSPESSGIRLRLADRMNLWGDFYSAEVIYREHLRARPGDRDVAMRLASLLKSTERYGEAEGIYRRLLAEFPGFHEALLEWAELKRRERRLDVAEDLIDRFLLLDPDHPEGLGLKAEILSLQQRHEDALSIYAELSGRECCRFRGLMGMGKAYLAQGKDDRARACFTKALEIAPMSVAARFHAEGLDRAASDEVLNALLKDEKTPSIILEKWAELYARNGYNGHAIRCREAALQMDPEYFPSEMGLAEILAVDHQVDRAVERFESLDREYPENRKVLMGWARALGWSKQYGESLALYDRIHGIAPADPVSLVEKARTAAWAKEMGVALKTYEGLQRPAVDRALVRSLRPLVEASGDSGLIQDLRALEDRVANGSVYQGFEAFEVVIERRRGSLPADTASQMEMVLADLYPAFVVQKAAYLEGEGKRLAWNRRFVRSMETYEGLIDFAPGNQEAAFDYAQIQCALGLCDREETSYERLLAVDPLHSMAALALERAKIRGNPSLETGGRYWSERGRGELAAMDRYRTDLGLDVPVDCRFHLRFAGHHWVEHPSDSDTSYGADGFTLGFSGVFNPSIRGEAGWTRKVYRWDAFEDTDTGYARVWWNLRDLVTVGLGYERTDELTNEFGIQQGIQADAYRFSLQSHITRRLEALAQVRTVHYTDDNDLRHVVLAGGYSFTDHPRTLKVTVTGEYRDAREPNVFHYDGERLVDITHPYWTPEDYAAGAVTLSWNHDLSERLFCGAERHVYDLALTVGTDTEHNPSVAVRGEWHVEFLDHWTFHINGLIHRSELWDAESVGMTLRYRF